MNSRWKKFAWIFLVALAVRIFYFSVAPGRSMNQDDTLQWNNTALHFLHGEGFLKKTEDLDPRRPPIYPLFMAIHYLLFGENNFLSIQWSQIILSSSISVLMGGIAFLIFGSPMDWLVGMLCASYPPLVVYSVILQGETLFTFLLILFIWFWIQYQKKGLFFSFLCGFVLGILTLCRGTILFFLPVLLFLFIWKRHEDWRKPVLILGVALFLVAPWTWRNWKVYHTFIPVVSGGPEIFFLGTLPIESQKEVGHSKEWKNLQVPSNPKESESYFWKLAFQSIRLHPTSYACLTVKKFLYYWLKPIGQELISKKSPLLGYVLVLTQLGLILLFLHGIILTRSLWNTLLPLYSLILFFAVFHILLAPGPRFRLPIEPLFLLFAAVSILHWMDWMKQHE